MSEHKWKVGDKVEFYTEVYGVGNENRHDGTVIAVPGEPHDLRSSIASGPMGAEYLIQRDNGRCWVATESNLKAWDAPSSDSVVISRAVLDRLYESESRCREFEDVKGNILSVVVGVVDYIDQEDIAPDICTNFRENLVTVCGFLNVMEPTSFRKDISGALSAIKDLIYDVDQYRSAWDTCYEWLNDCSTELENYDLGDSNDLDGVVSTFDEAVAAIRYTEEPELDSTTDTIHALSD